MTHGRMLGLFLLDRSLRVRRDLPVPQPVAGEALIRVRMAGICSTDLQMVKGYHPFRGVPGHEFVGEIVARPPTGMDIGQRVVGEINIPCGNCVHCLAGRDRHCLERKVLGIRDHDGAFAQYLVLPGANLHAVPDTVSDQAAVFAEPLAAALRVTEQVPVGPGDRVLVVGAGRLGMLVAMVLTRTGADLQVVIRHGNQRRILRALGIDTVGEDGVESGAFDLVVDASGAAGGFRLAMRAVRAQGTLVMKSTYKGEASVDLSSLVVNEVHLLGSRCGPFGPALRLLADGVVDPVPLIEARYRLSDGLAAMEHAARRGVLKVLLEMEGPE